MEELKKTLATIPKLGTAKIAGLTCNKRSPVTLRIDLEVPHEELGSALAALKLEGTEDVLKSLETVLEGLKRQGK